MALTTISVVHAINDMYIIMDLLAKEEGKDWGLGRRVNSIPEFGPTEHSFVASLLHVAHQLPAYTCTCVTVLSCMHLPTTYTKKAGLLCSYISRNCLHGAKFL